MKKFWKNVSVLKTSLGYQIQLDKTLLSIKGSAFYIPLEHEELAHKAANEWRVLDQVTKEKIPLTNILMRSTNINLDHLLFQRLLNTDSICFYQKEPQKLVELQKKHWDPIIDYCKSTFNVQINIHDGLMGAKQPIETQKTLINELNSFSKIKLSGFEHAALGSKSFLIALMLSRNAITVLEATNASQVEVDAQMSKWGLDDSHKIDRQITSSLLNASLMAMN